MTRQTGGWERRGRKDSRLSSPPRGRAAGSLCPQAPAYDWSPEAQGFLLSALSVGSFLASIPSGFVVGACGVKYPVGVAMLASSVLNLFVPLAADAGVASLFALRTVQGVAQVPGAPQREGDGAPRGRAEPTVGLAPQVVVSVGQYAAWVKWAPALEKNQLVAIAASGNRCPACPRHHPP